MNKKITNALAEMLERKRNEGEERRFFKDQEHKSRKECMKYYIDRHKYDADMKARDIREKADAAIAGGDEVEKQKEIKV